MKKPDFLLAKNYKMMADHNAKLCADLVEECNSQGKIIDELTEENADLKARNSRLVDDYRTMEKKLFDTNAELDKARSALDKIWSLADAELP